MIPGLPPGIYSQTYRAATGYAPHRKAWLRDSKALGVVGHIEHGGESEKKPLTPDIYRKLRDETHDAGFTSGMAVGPGDFGTVENAKRYAGKVAAIGKHADYTVCDLEGLHEDQFADIERGCAFFAELRALLGPNAIIIDQPPAKPIPHFHSSPLWRLAAQWVSVRAPMLYANNLRGTGKGKLGDDAWRRMIPDYLDAWDNWVPNNTPAIALPAKPWVPTWQGYHWVQRDLVTALTQFDTCLLWGENHSCESDGERSIGPYPTDPTRYGMRVVMELRRLGFTGIDAVRKWQESVGLKADNDFGPKSRAKLGL